MKREQDAFQDIRKQFASAGFEVIDTERLRTFGVKKYNCLRILELDSSGGATPAGPPYFIVHELNCELEDRGYQKFWYAQGKRFPIRLADLKSLHRFDEEVRRILGLKSLYHESLGTTSPRTAYDRLDGRPDR
jgi:hypothetical protein